MRKRLEDLSEEDSPWYESPDEQDSAIHRMYQKLWKKLYLADLFSIGVVPHSQQQCIEMVFFEGKSVKEVSQILKISGPAVRNRIKQAITTLHTYIQEHCHE